MVHLFYFVHRNMILNQSVCIFSLGYMCLLNIYYHKLTCSCYTLSPSIDQYDVSWATASDFQQLTVGGKFDQHLCKSLSLFLWSPVPLKPKNKKYQVHNSIELYLFVFLTTCSNVGCVSKSLNFPYHVVPKNIHASTTERNLLTVSLPRAT